MPLSRQYLTALLCVLALIGCGPTGWQPTKPDGDDQQRAHVNAPRADYTTIPSPGGIRGGDLAQDLARLIRAHFSGLSLSSDGRLADLAARVVQIVLERGGMIPDETEIDALARECGIVGPVPFVVLVPRMNGRWVDLERHVSSFPSNLRFTHIGVSVIDLGDVVQGAAVLGAQHLTLSAVPRAVAENGTIAFVGRVDAEYREARWVWNLPDGSTRPIPATTDGDLTFTTEPLVPGVHRFEVFGVGPVGLEVLANIPITVGSVLAKAEGPEVVDESEPATALLELINRARARAGARPVTRTLALDRIADAHSNDMVTAHFFGHQSPTTGNTDDRMVASGVRICHAGENVARAGSMARAHRFLMESPGHRQLILEPSFTHVGIGIVRDPRANPPAYSVTEVFGTFPGPLTDPGGFAAALFEQMNRSRTEKGVSLVAHKRRLDDLAWELAARIAAEPNIRADEARQVVKERDFRNLGVTQVRVLPIFAATPEEIASILDLVEPSFRWVGVGVAQADATLHAPRTNVAVFVLGR